MNLKYLPSYIPQLNPIEEVFSLIKSRYYNIRPFASNANTIKQYIETVIRELNSDSNISLIRFYERMRLFLDRAFKLNHLIKISFQMLFKFFLIIYSF